MYRVYWQDGMAEIRPGYGFSIVRGGFFHSWVPIEQAQLGDLAVLDHTEPIVTLVVIARIEKV